MVARGVRPIVAILLVCLCAGTARAQQPSAAVSAAAQVLTGEEFRLAGQNRFEPDIGVLLFDPWFRFGTLEVAVSATRRDEQAVLGRSFVHLDGAKLAGLSWTIDAGDAWRMPTLSNFGFANLFAPPVTFEGVSISGASARTRCRSYGGRVTAQQNIFGTDTVPVGQQVYQASLSHRVNERLDVYGCGAHVRNGTVKLYPAFVDVSHRRERRHTLPGDAVDRGLGRGRVRAIPPQGFVRRRALTVGAGWGDLVGASRMAAVQRPLPASRLLPGDQLSLQRPGRRLCGRRMGRAPAGPALRGCRVRNDGPRRSRRRSGGVGRRPRDPDPRLRRRARARGRSIARQRARRGRWPRNPAIQFQQRLRERHRRGQRRLARRVRALERLRPVRAPRERRPESTRGRASPSTTRRFTRTSASAPDVRSSPRRWSPAAPTVPATDRRYGRSAAGCRCRWPAGTCGSKATRAAPATGPPRSRRTGSQLAVGFSGQIARNTTFSARLLRRSIAIALVPGSPWTTRTMMRVTRSFPFGTARSAALPGSPVRGAARRAASQALSSPTGTVTGNSIQTRKPSAGFRWLSAGAGTVTSGTDGRFSFAGVPVGETSVVVDLSTLPADYDAPAEPERAVEIARNRASDVAIGLLPLTSIAGVVYQDADGDGQLSASRRSRQRRGRGRSTTARAPRCRGQGASGSTPSGWVHTPSQC